MGCEEKKKEGEEEERKKRWGRAKAVWVHGSEKEVLMTPDDNGGLVS